VKRFAVSVKHGKRGRPAAEHHEGRFFRALVLGGRSPHTGNVGARLRATRRAAESTGVPRPPEMKQAGERLE
jgi:hypothetical protein